MTPLLEKLLILLLSFASFLFLARADHQVGSFSADLIHRDSPASPLYDPNMTSLQRWNDAFRRSQQRVWRFSDSISPVRQTLVASVETEYLMSIKIGSPPHEMKVLIDTGSDLLWVRCEPCTGACAPPPDPPFRPAGSRTYHKLSCHDPRCRSLRSTKCGTDDFTCVFIFQYGTESISQGEVAFETITFDFKVPPVSYNNILYGCSRSAQGAFVERLGGIIGLGAGPNSLVGQVSRAISGTFSYCLPPWNVQTPGTIFFGRNGGAESPHATRTRLHTKDRPVYYVNLIAITIGRYMHDFPPYVAGKRDGNTIVDSGTTFSFVPPDYQRLLVDALNPMMLSKGAQPVSPAIKGGLCYRTVQGIAGIQVLLHFEDDVLPLRMENLFAHLEHQNVDCFSIVPSPDGDTSLVGSVMQTNTWVEYDTLNSKVMFNPVTSCSSG